MQTNRLVKISNKRLIFLLGVLLLPSGCSTIVDPGPSQPSNGTLASITGTIINWQDADSITLRAEKYIEPSSVFVFGSSAIGYNGAFSIPLSVPPSAALIKLTPIDSGAATLSISDTSASLCTINLILYRPNNTRFAFLMNKYKQMPDSALVGDFNSTYCYSDRNVTHIGTTQFVNALGDTVKFSFTFQFKQGWNRLKTTLIVKKPHLLISEGKVDNIPDGSFFTF